MHSALVLDLKTEFRNHKKCFEAEISLQTADMISMTSLLTIHFSSSDQVFCLLCLLHLSNVNKEEVMAGVKRDGALFSH